MSDKIKSRLARPAALKDWAYETIKAEILNLRIRPGAVLHVNDLADQLAVSRTPVREALLRLEGEGLVRVESRVGFFVTEITRDDLENLFELRALLEGYAAQTAAPFLTEDDIDQIERAFDSCSQAIGQGQVQEFMEADVAFHTLLMERAPNPRLAEMMSLLEDLTHREHVLGLRSSENVRESCAEHQEILKALRRQDGELAGQLMRKHLCAVRDRLVGLLDLSDLEERSHDATAN